MKKKQKTEEKKRRIDYFNLIVIVIIIVMIALKLSTEPIHLYIIALGIWFIAFQNEVKAR